MRAVLVVLDEEAVEQALEFADGGGLLRLSAEPFLQCLLEPFDLALGLGMVGLTVLLGDVQGAELSLEVVAATFAAGEFRW